jgi:4-amino-4-deoxy-L-arabinose transferase-like glycosyltransferase
MFAEFQQLIQTLDNFWLIVLLLVALSGIGFSGFLHPRSPRYALWILFFVNLAIALFFAFLDPFLHAWDEVYHALVAHNLAETPLIPRLYTAELIPLNHETWIANHIWLHKPPLSLWQMALSIKLFGASYWSIRLPSILMHALLTFPIYRMGAILFTKQAGFVGAVIFTCLNYPLELVAGVHTADHVDVTFMFYITLSVWSWLEYRRTSSIYWLMLMGLFSGAAILTKWLVGLLVYAGAGACMLLVKNLRMNKREWMRLIIAFGVTLLVVLPWNIYAAINFPTEYWYEMQFSARHFSEVIEHHGGDYWFYWNNLKTLYGDGDLIQYILLAAVLFFTIRGGNDNPVHRIFILAVLLAPYLFFSFATTKMNSFLVIVSPVLMLMVAGAITQLTNWGWEKVNNAKAQRITGAIAVLSASLFLLRPNALNNNHYFGKEHLNAHRKAEITKHEYMQTALRECAPKTVIELHNAAHSDHAFFMFYNPGFLVYSNLSPEARQQIQEGGYAVMDIDLEGIQNP